MPRALETNAGIAQLPPDRGVLRPRPRLRPARCRTCSARSRCDEVQRGRAPRRSIPTARPSSSPGPYQESMTRFAAVFFDVDFTLIYPGPDVPGRGLPGVLRALRHRRRSGARSTRRWPAPRRCSTSPKTRRTTPRSSSPTRGTSSSRWAGSGDRARRLRARDLRRVGGLPALRALRRRAGGAARAGGARHPHRADLELAPLPGVVPVAFRAAGADRRRGLVVRARLHEAASEHLRGGAAAGRRDAGARR